MKSSAAHLKVQHVQTEPTRQSIGNVEHVVIEGYIHALDDKGLNINNQIIAFESAQISAGNTRSDFRLDQRIQISGRLGTDQRVIAEHIELKHESPVQLQERNDRSQIDSSGRGNKKNNLENEPEIKPAKGNESSQSHRDSHSDGNKDSLKKEIDHNSGRNHASDSDSRSGNLSSFKDEKESDHSGFSWRERTEKLQDNREQNSSDYQSIGQLERSERSDAQDRPGSHRDNLRDNDVPDRAIDHRDNLRDIDISDRVRDHSVHHDRHFDR